MFWNRAVVVYFSTATNHRSRGASWSIIAPPFIAVFDDTARQALYPVTKGILRKVNKLALTALRLAAVRKAQVVNEAILVEATGEALL